MFSITDGFIKLTQGDDISLTVTLKNQDGTSYTMQSGDVLTLTVRSQIGGTVLLTQTSTTSTITVPHSKTKALTAGPCCYDIQLVTASDSKVYTVAGVTDTVALNMYVYAKITEAS